MPNTLIREGYIDSDRVSQLCDFDDRVFFRLLLAADDAGRADGRVDKLRSALFPTRERVRGVDVERALGRLMEADLIARWMWDGKPVIQVRRWQRRSGAKYSKLPGPDGSFAIEWVEVETRDGKQSFSATSMQGVSEPIDNPSEGGSRISPKTETHTETKTQTEKGAGEPIPEGLDTPQFHAAWADWLEYKRQRKDKLTEIGKQRQLTIFARYGPAVAIESIQQAIEKGWTGTFPESVGKRRNGHIPRPSRTAQVDR